MRRHGIVNFPGPDSDGQLPSSIRQIDRSSLECPRFGGQLSAGLSGPAERLFGHAKEAEVPEAVPA
jgi:hypothetical protein